MKDDQSTSLNPVPRRRAMDMAPRPAATPAKAAGAVHSRVKPARVLDLSKVAVTTPVPAEISRDTSRVPAAPPKATAHDRHLAEVSKRFEAAKQHQRSPHIQKFTSQYQIPIEVEPAPEIPAVVTPVPAPPELPHHAATHHEAMSRLIRPEHAIGTEIPRASQVSSRPKGNWKQLRFNLSPSNSRALAVTAAIAIMAGYVWLQNYPKLAIQTANSKAGLAASLPGYVPSSYNLDRTDTAPGLVTLNFSSPSSAERLKIAQQRTGWDSSSLLDNFVAKNTDDYATVQGQGLTVYLFNDNQATWVNHGVWYSIEGASRLSREQVLKIAYSL